MDYPSLVPVRASFGSLTKEPRCQQRMNNATAFKDYRRNHHLQTWQGTAASSAAQSARPCVNGRAPKILACWPRQASRLADQSLRYFGATDPGKKASLSTVLKWEGRGPCRAGLENFFCSHLRGLRACCGCWRGGGGLQ